MFQKSSGWFQDLTVFASFLIIFNSLVESGYGQQPPLLPAGTQAYGGSQSSVVPLLPKRGAQPLLNPAAPNAGSTFRTTANSVTRTVAALPAAVQSTLQSIPSAVALAPAGTSRATAVGQPKPDAHYSPAGFRLHPAQPATRALSLAKNPMHPSGPVGKAVHPLQLNGPDDATDPYIVNQAQALGNDPNQIFAFVRDQIAYNVYAGSLRGARGTLWSQAGNALDRASLLMALLKAAGYSPQYVQGKLSKVQAQSLIVAMFQGTYAFTGCLPPGSAVADPANDPTLLGIVENHYWVQYNGGTNLDTAFPASQPGQVFGTAPSTFTSVPSNLQHTVTFEVDAEQYSQAARRSRRMASAARRSSTSRLLPPRW